METPPVAGPVVIQGALTGDDARRAVDAGVAASLRARPEFAAAGEAGVARALAILRAVVECTFTLLGCPSVAVLDQSYVEVPAHWRCGGRRAKLQRPSAVVEMPGTRMVGAA